MHELNPELVAALSGDDPFLLLVLERDKCGCVREFRGLYAGGLGPGIAGVRKILRAALEALPDSDSDAAPPVNMGDVVVPAKHGMN